MAIRNSLIISCLCFFSALYGDTDPRHVLFLMSSGKTDMALEVYDKYYKETGKHDFEILEEIGRILIDQGCMSKDLETAMIGLYGVAMSNLSSAESFLSEAIKSPHPNVQLVALQLLSRLNTDSIEPVMAKGMNSAFLMIRLETLFHLTSRRSSLALSHIDGLMRILPPEFRVYFPEFFATLGTKEATKELKSLIADGDLQVRLSSILSTAKFMRDDLLPDIRSALSHANPAEKEAAAFAVGMLGDSKSIDVLKELSSSNYDNIKLAALRSRLSLGDESVIEPIKEMAMGGNLFAIQVCGALPNTSDLLYMLSTSPDPSIKLNSIMALLSKRDERSVEPLLDLIIRDETDIGFLPTFSLGRSFIAWKPVPSAHQQAKALNTDIEAITWRIKEELLTHALELPESAFLKIASEVFNRGQYELVPLVVRLLENTNSEEAITLLQYNANRIGAPLLRSYCLLGLYRIGCSKEYSDKFLSWINLQKGAELFKFRPIALRQLNVDQTTKYHLTPEENSALLLESLEALARRHEKSSIDCIVSAIRDGNKKNRPALGGLLLLAIN
ncbi:MAG: HEAT repeat domain-containing protein [Rhabdochlamydiaceae bacterium]|nr:HEAT repeat domain-containing protein [Candidatus Amphrikana amoebophyrae]